MANEIVNDHLALHSGNGDIEVGNITGRDVEMGNVTGDNLSTRIDQKLQVLSSEPSAGTIFRVPEILRNENEKAYEPLILAIGPYHRGKIHLRVMEKHKIRFLKLLLNRRMENSTNSYVEAMRELEGKARACYVDTINLESDEFVEMMLLDACFIVELVRKFIKRRYPIDDPVLKGGWIMTTLRRDLLLIENQLPFFVLQKFFDMTDGMSDDEESLCHLIFKLFTRIPKPGQPKDEGYIRNAEHLLGLFQGSWRYRHREIVALNLIKAQEFTTKESNLYSPRTSISKWFHLCSKMDNWIRSCICSRLRSSIPENHMTFIRCATELFEAGIKFQKFESDNLFCIKFENGILKIPTLIIEDHTESFFRNFIAYEQYYQDSRMNYVTDYVKFMDCLISTSKDVELLCKCEIIENGLSNDLALANMFNRLCDNVSGAVPVQYMYQEISEEIDKYFNWRWNKWKANLRHNYFNTPWALISVLAASLLLLLTVIQTVFSVLAYMETI